MTLDQQTTCPKVIVDVVSIQHGTVDISLYHCIRNKETYERSELFADQSFSIRRISARTVDEIDKNVNILFKTQRNIASIEQERQELADLCEKLVARTSESQDSPMQKIHARAMDIENQLGRSIGQQGDFDTIRSELLEMEEGIEDK